MANGIIYVSAPDNVWAIDARSAASCGATRYPANDGFNIGHRGVAVLGDLVYLTTPDAHLVALDARTGTVRWNVEIADARRGYWSTNAPLIIRNHLIVGVSGDFDNLPGILEVVRPRDRRAAVDLLQHAARGHARLDQRRRHRRTDVDDRHLRPGAEPALRRHRQSDAGAQWRRAAGRQQVDRQHPRAQSRTPARSRGASRRCRTTHTTGMRRRCRCSWMPTFRGEPRKLLLQASRNGYFFVLDRVTGKNLLTVAVCHGQLGERDRRRRTARSESRQGPGSRRTADLAGRIRRHQLPVAGIRSGHRPV